VFLGEISSSRRYSKKDYSEKKKIGTWNVRRKIGKFKKMKCRKTGCLF
jgi:hypothetical protein